jgi:hypothetical protein
MKTTTRRAMNRLRVVKDDLTTKGDGAISPSGSAASDAKKSASRSGAERHVERIRRATTRPTEKCAEMIPRVITRHIERSAEIIRRATTRHIERSDEMIRRATTRHIERSDEPTRLATTPHIERCDEMTPRVITHRTERCAEMIRRATTRHIERCGEPTRLATIRREGSSVHSRLLPPEKTLPHDRRNDRRSARSRTGPIINSDVRHTVVAVAPQSEEASR